MKIGIRIQERLKLLGMSQSELARRLNVPQSTINGLGSIDIQRSQIMAAARNTKPVKWTVRRS